MVNISGMSVLVAFSSESLSQFFGGLSVLNFVLRLNMVGRVTCLSYFRTFPYFCVISRLFRNNFINRMILTYFRQFELLWHLEQWLCIHIRWRISRIWKHVFCPSAINRIKWPTMSIISQRTLCSTTNRSTVSIKKSQKKKSEGLPFTLTFNPHKHITKSIIFENFKLPQKDPETSSTYSQPPLASLKRGKNIGNFPVRLTLFTIYKNFPGNPVRK